MHFHSLDDMTFVDNQVEPSNGSMPFRMCACVWVSPMCWILSPLQLFYSGIANDIYKIIRIWARLPSLFQSTAHQHGHIQSVINEKSGLKSSFASDLRYKGHHNIYWPCQAMSHNKLTPLPVYRRTCCIVQTYLQSWTGSTWKSADEMNVAHKLCLSIYFNFMDQWIQWENIVRMWKLVCVLDCTTAIE